MRRILLIKAAGLLSAALIACTQAAAADSGPFGAAPSSGGYSSNLRAIKAQSMPKAAPKSFQSPSFVPANSHRQSFNTLNGTVRPDGLGGYYTPNGHVSRGQLSPNYVPQGRVLPPGSGNAQSR